MALFSVILLFEACERNQSPPVTIVLPSYTYTEYALDRIGVDCHGTSRMFHRTTNPGSLLRIVVNTNGFDMFDAFINKLLKQIAYQECVCLGSICTK